MIQNGNLVPVLGGILAILGMGFFIYYNYQKEVVARLRGLLLTDEQFELPNLRYFSQHLERVTAWAGQHKRTFSLLAIEVDRLDEYDLNRETRRKILKSVLGKITQHLLPADFVAVQRINRFCFLVVIPESGLVAAKMTAEEILQDVMSGCNGGKMSLVTVSIGVLGVAGEKITEPKSRTDLEEKAMRLMYQAGHQGGARVVAAEYEVQ